MARKPSSLLTARSLPFPPPPLSSQTVAATLPTNGHHALAARLAAVRLRRGDAAARNSDRPLSYLPLHGLSKQFYLAFSRFLGPGRVERQLFGLRYQLISCSTAIVLFRSLAHFLKLSRKLEITFFLSGKTSFFASDKV